MTDAVTPLPERPPLSAPAAGSRRATRQPGLGLAGLLLVVPVAVVLAFGAGGAEPSVLVLGPLVTFGLPVIAMIAFWWEDWPGAGLPRPWSGITDTVLVIIGAVVLAIIGQAVLSRIDLAALFDPRPPAGHKATFPGLMPLSGAAFVAMLQLTLVTEGWPLRRLGRYLSGVIAVVVAWAVAVCLSLLVTDHAVAGADFGAVLVTIGAWQVWWYVVWRGWPMSGIRLRAVRLVTANAVILCGAAVTFFVLRAYVEPETISAAAGSFVGAGLIVGMLFENTCSGRWSPGVVRAVNLAACVLLAAACYIGFSAYAESLQWTKATVEDWVAHVGLNAIGVSVILHVAVGRRWPFGEPTEADTRAVTARERRAGRS